MVTTKAGVPITDPRLVELGFLCDQEQKSLRVQRRRAKRMPTALPWQQRRAIYLVTSGSVRDFKTAMTLLDSPVLPNTATEGSRGSGVRP
jgi:hypothetical protein